MRALVPALAVLLSFGSLSSAAEPHHSRHSWLRRLTLAGACAASFWDLQTTLIGVNNGAHEANPLFADSQGRPRWGRIVGFKAGSCVASFIAEEHFANRGPSDRFWLGVNSVTAASFSAVAIHNLKIAAANSPSR